MDELIYPGAGRVRKNNDGMIETFIEGKFYPQEKGSVTPSVSTQDRWVQLGLAEHISEQKNYFGKFVKNFLL